MYADTGHIRLAPGVVDGGDRDLVTGRGTAVGRAVVSEAATTGFGPGAAGLLEQVGLDGGDLAPTVCGSQLPHEVEITWARSWETIALSTSSGPAPLLGPSYTSIVACGAKPLTSLESRVDSTSVAGTAPLSASTVRTCSDDSIVAAWSGK